MKGNRSCCLCLLLFICLGISWSISPLVSATTGSLVSNGSFTSNISSWTSSQTAGNWIAAHDNGSAKEYIAGENVTGEGYLYQNVTNNFTSMDSATMTFKYSKSWSGATASKQEAAIDIVSPGGTITTLWSENSVVQTQSWSSLQAINILTYMSSAGTYTLRLRSSLQSGNTSGATAAVYFDDVQITVSGTANTTPAVQVTAPNGGENWYGSQTIQWRGADADQNVITYKIYLSLDAGTNWSLITTVNYQESSSVTTRSYTLNTTLHNDSDNALIKVVASDGVVDATDSSDTYFSIINTVRAPTLSTPQNGVSISNVTPTLDWSDVSVPVGVDHYALQVASNIGFSAVIYTTNVSISHATTDNLSDGTYYWRVKTVDASSNDSGWSDTWSFEVYTYAPTVTSFSINSSASYTTNQVVTLTTSANHSLYISFSTDGGTTWTDWESYSSATTKQVQLPTGDGTKTIQVKTKDSIGHISQYTSSSIVLDTVAPSTTPVVTGDAGEEGQYKGSAVINFSAIDSTSGVDYVFYRVDKGDWTTGTTTAVLGDGSHTVEYFALDTAGNKEQVKQLLVKIYTPISPVPYLAISIAIGGVLVFIYVWRKKGFPILRSKLTVRKVSKEFEQQLPDEIRQKIKETKMIEPEEAERKKRRDLEKEKLKQEKRCKKEEENRNKLEEEKKKEMEKREADFTNQVRKAEEKGRKEREKKLKREAKIRKRQQKLLEKKKKDDDEAEQKAIEKASRERDAEIKREEKEKKELEKKRKEDKKRRTKSEKKKKGTKKHSWLARLKIIQPKQKKGGGK